MKEGPCHLLLQSGENWKVQRKGLRYSLLQDNAHQEIMKENNVSLILLFRFKASREVQSH